MSVFNRAFRKMVVRGNPDGAAMSLDTLLAQFDQKLANFDVLIEPSLKSKPRTPFDSDLPTDKISMANLTLRQMMSILPIMIPFQINMRRGGTLYDEPFEPTRSEALEEFLSELRSAAMELGATDVKYVNVPKNAIFQNKGIPHKSAILFTIEMDAEKIASAPSFEALREVVKGYRNLAEISLKLSMMLRDQGFAAYPGTALGGLTDYCYLAEIAGIGANGYHGLLITPNGGSRVRINAIYTNITNLPVETENDHLWIRDLCAMCRQCVRQCPPKAIYDQPEPRGDGGMQCIDHDLCRDYFQSNFGCAVCIAVCPFSRAGYDKIKAHFKGNPSAPYYKIPAAELD